MLIGRIAALFRYPVKSMRGEPLDCAELGWHGIEGDRRLALRRLHEQSSTPWLTAGKLPQLVAFTPVWRERDADAPSHVRTPEGDELPVFGEALAQDIGRRHGAPVQMMHLRQGIFDEASISLIACDTIEELGRLAGMSLHVRRFRPNILIRTERGTPFEEEAWVGGSLTFGEGNDVPALSITTRDVRCAMVNLDPEEPRPAPEVLRTIVRTRHAVAGVYATVTRTGRLSVGQLITLR